MTESPVPCGRAAPRGRCPAALLVAVAALAGTVTACGHSAGAPARSGVAGVSCTNYALHGNGRYHDEVSVSVQVDNSTARRARYAIRVELSASHPRPAGAPATEITIDGSVASRASGELGHKVLTAGPVRQCRVTRVSRS
jgi:hypothetical protein